MSKSAGILVVAAQRELRRQLFDALDRQQQPTLLARDTAHAASLLQDRQPLALLVIAFEQDERAALDVCRQLQGIPACVGIPLIAVLAEGATILPTQLPPEVDDWLHHTRIDEELVERGRRLRPVQTSMRPGTILALLARLPHGELGDMSAGEAGRLLIDELGLDYLALWSASTEGDGTPTQYFHWWRGNEQDWPAAASQVGLHQVLNGETLRHPRDAMLFAGQDPLVRQLGLHGFVGVPLLDERRHVLGALLAGSRQPLGDQGLIESALRFVAAHFAHGLELRRDRSRSRSESLFDPLTRLPNRLLFDDRLESMGREASRTGECFALLFVGLDGFKAINDGLGRARGDQALITVARRLGAAVRESDTVARHSSDEFVVVLRHISRNRDVARIAEKIVHVLDVPLQLQEGVELQVSTAIGISFFPDDATAAETLLRHAEEAMRTAKGKGRNHFHFHEVSPEQARQQSLVLKSRLRHAEQNNELRVLYQPQVDALSEDIVGMEALLRWEHPQLGAIDPGFFIPLAEETGLIVPIGEWLLRTACQQAQAWERQYGLRLRLGVNLSAVQLMQPQLLDLVASVLEETGLEPGLLEMEVTESISIKQAPNLMENLRGLHRLGCRIAIDDFGTGAASLDYLRHLPADRIKIDQSFVRNIGVDPDDEAIVRATIEMAHQLNRGVVAEGVEFEQHLQFLRANGCDELQGYLFSRPLTVTKFDMLMSERRNLLAAG